MTAATLHHGDALTWLPTLAAGSVDLVLADPPYSSGGKFRGDRAGSGGSVRKYINTDSQARRQYPAFFGDTRDQRGQLAWCTLWLVDCYRALRDGALVCVFTDWRQLPLTTDALQAAGFVWRGIVAWDKTEASRLVAPGYPRHQCEYLVWGSKGPLERRPGGPGSVLPGCLRYPVGRGKQHPTEKPIALMVDLMRLCPPGGLVLDPFAGAGSTGVAALQTGRRFVGCELSDDYHAIASARLAEVA